MWTDGGLWRGGKEREREIIGAGLKGEMTSSVCRLALYLEAGLGWWALAADLPAALPEITLWQSCRRSLSELIWSFTDWDGGGYFVLLYVPTINFVECPPCDDASLAALPAGLPAARVVLYARHTAGRLND
ncbi:unnamed protein product [Danaus chrysippus]|uniref:(African queen) hypothetical protein n=1 Tax=Danaus chrysippus TaxID=151541 RepID=A0A8J2R2C8_9NEOP|nr:unnamed protein product [Danaus chrysippus]